MTRKTKSTLGGNVAPPDLIIAGDGGTGPSDGHQTAEQDQAQTRREAEQVGYRGDLASAAPAV